MKLLGLDVGEKRIGVAKADTNVKIAVPNGMVPVDGQEISALVRLCDTQNIDVVVVGMPRNLQGQLTQQSNYVKTFVKSLNKALLAAKPNNKTVKIFFQDESLTSVQAKDNLKTKGFNKKAGDVDAEAAAIILQDFLENLARRLVERKTPASNSPSVLNSSAPASANASDPSAKTAIPLNQANQKPLQPRFKSAKENTVKKWLAIRIIILVVAVLGLGYLGFSLWYNNALSSVVASDQCASIFKSDTADPCATTQITIEENSSVATIADLLKEHGLIRSPLAFRLYAKLSGNANQLNYGTYNLAPSMPVEKIYAKLLDGANDAVVFRFTVLPGETLQDIKQRLLTVGYTSEEIDAAFSKAYDHPVLADKPASASLEGYLFGETYEFYQTDSVETIVIRMLDELYTVVEKNNLRSKFNSMGYTLHEGIIMASIVQKEAGTVSKDDQKIVAQIFWTRLAQGMALGSDVTASYAADQVDPSRQTYTDNYAVLNIDSCYNTRRYAGLPCGAISNPGALVLISTANPADTSYLYFLTGDDGLMYYSNTEAEHLQNASAHCQVLCNAKL
ncbi:endolytic transglycosylase MltG [Candidatus Saccharibacteria bacterium]|nr:endolytic transglycosylase MltG [Candidatus Saccharibacteria bacterium]